MRRYIYWECGYCWKRKRDLIGALGGLLVAKDYSMIIHHVYMSAYRCIPLFRIYHVSLHVVILFVPAYRAALARA